jgi:hypothetical protein
VDFEVRRAKQIRTIIAVGRLNEDDKRLSYLLRAFAALRNEFGGWRLKLVGDGPHWEYYNIMAEQLGIKALVDFTGAVSDTEPHYNSADILCLPSLRAEGLPLVFLEASAHALPLVGYSSCISSAALIAPDMGAVADAESPAGVIDALAAALRSLMQLLPEERERMGVRVRDVLQGRYGGSIVYDELEALFARTLKKTREAGKTALEVIAEMNKAGTGIGAQWDGLEPDNPVWTPGLIAQAAAEFVGREDPLSTPESTSAPEEAESVRLRCELASLKADYTVLEKKYAALMGQFQLAAGGKKHGKRGKR